MRILFARVKSKGWHYVNVRYGVMHTDGAIKANGPAFYAGVARRDTQRARRNMDKQKGDTQGVSGSNDRDVRAEWRLDRTTMPIVPEAASATLRWQKKKSRRTAL